MPLERVPDFLRRAGAASVEDTIRWLGELCVLLLRAPSRIDAALISVGPPGTPMTLEVQPSSDDARGQVAALGRLGYELLKGAPPPEGPVPADAWVGVRPELGRLLAASIAGTGPADVAAFATQLRALRTDTAAYQLHDTAISGKQAAVALEGALAGTILGPYELLGLLGSGGMGEVYRARHARLGREVAVKVLRREYAAMPEVVQRFFQEAKIVNDINHPHIVQILDFVESPSAVYCVMELLQGRSLSTVVAQEGPLSLARISTLLKQVCEAIGAAHARGVVHRDLKPDNLFVTVDAEGREQVKVLDFGIARRLTPGDSARTQAGLVMGTPSYMAPEQAAGRPVDARADLYALGVVLYELLTGTSMSELTAQPTRVEVSAKGEPVPPRLADAVMTCLSLDPAMRPSSIAALRDAFEPEVRKGRGRWLLAAAVPLALIAYAVIPREAPSGLSAPLEDRPDAGVTQVVTRPEPVEDRPDAGVTQVVSRPAPVEDRPDGGETVRTPTGAREDAGVKKKVAPFAKRLTAIRARFDALVTRHGKNQLTSIERQTIEAALDPTATPGELPQLVKDAEASLADAERRLGQ